MIAEVSIVSIEQPNQPQITLKVPANLLSPQKPDLLDLKFTFENEQESQIVPDLK